MQDQLTGLADKIQLPVVSKKQISLASPQIESKDERREKRKESQRMEAYI